MQLTQSTSLEQSIMRLHTDNPENREWFYGTVVSILENENLPFFAKTDKISSALLSIDSKINYIREQTKILQNIKKQLELSRNKAKEEVAKALGSFGIDKLEGIKVSSITITPATETNKPKIDILDEDALIKAGFFSVIVDKKAIEEALYSADQRYEVEAFVKTYIETKKKPATIRINKRKSLSTEEPIQIEAA